MKITLNGEPHEISPGSSIADVLSTMQISVRHVAVEVNQEIVPRSKHPEHLLADGDSVEVVTLVGGG